MKALIAQRFNRKAAIEALEEDPSSEPQKAALAQALANSGASDDADVQELARQLADALLNMPAADTTALGLDIEDLQATSVKLKDIAAQGTAVHIRRTTVAGSFEAEGIRAGQQEFSSKN